MSQSAQESDDNMLEHLKVRRIRKRRTLLPNSDSGQANKGILADTVARDLNVPRRTAARVLDAVLDSVAELLRHNGKVAIKGFGNFERRIRKGRDYKHPLTGESIPVPDKATVYFTPSNDLIEKAHTPLPPKPAPLVPRVASASPAKAAPTPVSGA